MATNPMHQFEVYRIGPEIVLGSVNFSFTNASLFMVLSAVTILFLLFISTKKKIINTYKNATNLRNELYICCEND